MSTLEKFGILVILILVVIIGVVAVWGVGGDTKNPFGNGDGISKTEPAAGPPDAATDPGKGTPDWPATGATPATDGSVAGVQVAPPAIGTAPTPAAGPPGAPAPVPTATASASSYTVQKGDTPSKIALQTLGDRNKWPEIAKANPGVDPRRLKIGMELHIPGQGGGTVAKAPSVAKPTPRVNTLEKLNPDDTGSDAPPPRKAESPKSNADAPKSPAPAATSDGTTREVEVRSGDTLYEISRRELGDPNLYYKILKANPGLDPKRLKVGMRIKVPAEK